MKRAIIIVCTLFLCFEMKAQTSSIIKTAPPTKAFSKVDIGMSLGTTGIGVEASTPLSSVVSLRGGFDIMPPIMDDVYCHVMVSENDKSMTYKQRRARFDKMAKALYDITGYKADSLVRMEVIPRMYNFKLLVDIRPLKDKRWYISAGFYWGNKRVATAENCKEDMTSLFSVGLYNRMYEHAANSEPITVNGKSFDLPMELEDKLLQYGRMSIHVGDYKHDMKDAEGNIIHKKGDPYSIEPDENSMVKATMKVNNFRPYLGFGFMGQLTKNDPDWKIGFDAGALFWGGTPSLKTHDGTDLIKDITNVRHYVKRYVNLGKLMVVMPVINLRITKTL